MVREQFVLKRALLMSLVDATPVAIPAGVESQLRLPWSEEGFLPFKEIAMTSTQLLKSPLVTGWGTGQDCWDRDKRSAMATELVQRLTALSKLSVREVVVSGEFVELLSDPESIEGYFRIDGDRFPLPLLNEFLAVFEPRLSWGSVPGHDTDALVRLYPVFCYVRDGNLLEVSTAPVEHFHTDALGREKGVVRLGFSGKCKEVT